jgi:hypothetical protein
MLKRVSTDWFAQVLLKVIQEALAPWGDGLHGGMESVCAEMTCTPKVRGIFLLRANRQRFGCRVVPGGRWR